MPVIEVSYLLQTWTWPDYPEDVIWACDVAWIREVTVTYRVNSMRARLGGIPRTHSDIMPKQRKTIAPSSLLVWTCNWCFTPKFVTEALFRKPRNHNIYLLWIDAQEKSLTRSHLKLQALRLPLSFMKAATLYRKYVLNIQRMVAAVLKRFVKIRNIDFTTISASPWNSSHSYIQSPNHCPFLWSKNPSNWSTRVLPSYAVYPDFRYPYEVGGWLEGNEGGAG